MISELTLGIVNRTMDMGLRNLVQANWTGPRLIQQEVEARRLAEGCVPEEEVDAEE